MESIYVDVPMYDKLLQLGNLSHAGLGLSSCFVEMFLIMAGTSVQQPKIFGSNVWKIPFGYTSPGEVFSIVCTCFIVEFI